MTRLDSTKLENVLFVGTGYNSITDPDLKNNLFGISRKVTRDTTPITSTTAVNHRKNINIALDKFDNNLFIYNKAKNDIFCYHICTYEAQNY